jgi:hypothetical protein
MSTPLTPAPAAAPYLIKSKAWLDQSHRARQPVDADCFPVKQRVPVTTILCRSESRRWLSSLRRSIHSPSHSSYAMVRLYSGHGVVEAFICGRLGTAMARLRLVTMAQASSRIWLFLWCIES